MAPSALIFMTNDDAGQPELQVSAEAGMQEKDHIAGAWNRAKIMDEPSPAPATGIVQGPILPGVASLQSIWDFLVDEGDCEGESTCLPESQGVSCGLSDSPSHTFALSSAEVCYLQAEAADGISPKQFEEPCKPVGTSGGTAAFFNVRYKHAYLPIGRDVEHYIGKDLSHAGDEVEFYSKLQTASDKETCWANFAKIAMECPGTCRLSCMLPRSESPETRNLLLLENMRQGFKAMRLIDVKLGAETSVAHWKGKSRLHAWKNQCVDQRTNSVVQGFRLEGMELKPRALEDYLDVLVESSVRKNISPLVSAKAVKRFGLQRLKASVFLAAWLDLSSHGAGAELHAHGAVWSAIDGVNQLVHALRDIPVPQMWIGSSLAIGYDVGELRRHPKLVVKVFDWGRAELNTAGDHAKLTLDEKKERVRHWRNYTQAVVRIQWELLRIAEHRCCCASWKAFILELRKETLSVVRAALIGPRVDDVVGMGIYSVPIGGLPHDAVNLVIPLLNAPRTPRGSPLKSGSPIMKPSSPTSKAMSGVLHVRVSTHPNRRHGEGSTVVDIRGATQLPAELQGQHTRHESAIVVRVIGFENIPDARAHLESFRLNLPEPTPAGRAYARTTAPGKPLGATMVFEDGLEFHGLGATGAQEAHARLSKAVDMCLAGGSGCAGDNSAAPELSEPGEEPRPASEQKSHLDQLPPTMGDAELAEQAAADFAVRAFPWLANDEPPAEWL